ncbi:MAG: sigma 54-interacting transcriptional regulator [Desulfobacteraceae bacterium]|nr:sigma 54-interacting transcriptional regulator [Desulfobacteraceae bacterium]MBC2756081.1 sigma 54-interacting transcriptional regulator [Desulfobacteraceae bacterium]MBC2763761.1 sigma 54-interacting transcriptional regulator [ANME-2 cluster archaeon]
MTQPKEIWNNRFANLLLDSMAEGVFTLNADGIIRSWNPSMEKISGYTAKESIGRTCRMLKFSSCFNRSCPEDARECGIFQKGAMDPTECKLMHKKGHFVSVIKNARLVKDEDGSVIGIVETLTDLTDLTLARQKVEEARQKLLEIHQFGNLIGKSHVMQEVFKAIKAAANSDATILIQGESGTGKELVAGAIHYNHDRFQKPMVAVNGSALSESLLESELFGHVKGAYTGAHRDRKGRFEEADGGTIFLDEIGDISPFIQLKLLRAIQEKQIERVGESRKRHVDIRIITATHEDLYNLVAQGLFREDLYYRLKVFPIHIPPLRKRKEDIPLLVRHFINQFNQKTGKSIKGVTSDALRVFMDYRWPGNVRELENAIEHAFVLCTTDQISIFDLPVEIRQMEYRPGANDAPELSPTRIKKKITKSGLLELLYEYDWNKAEVSRRIGKSRTSVWKYMKKWGIPLEMPEG